MGNIIIRRATIEDLQIVQKLNNKLFELEYENFDPALRVGWPYSKKGIEYFTRMLNDEAVFIALNNNIIVGYLAGSINFHPSCATKTLAEIDNMFIEEEYRKSGIGTLLINEFKNYCSNLGIEEMKVTASAKNTNAINFYKKNGFEDFEVTFKTKLN